MAVFTIGSKTLSGSPTGGAVGGASNLTTVGAIPYVSASGVLNQDATKLFWDSTNGRLGVGTGSPSSTADVVGTLRAASVASSAGDPTSGSGVEIAYRSDLGYGQVLAYNRTGAAYLNLRITSAFTSLTNGNVGIGGTTDGNYKLDIQASGSTGTLRVYDQTATTGSTKAVVRAGAGQSGNLQEWQNNAGSALAAIDSSGNVIPNSLVVGTTAITSTGLAQGSARVLTWSSTTNYFGTADLGLSRNAAGVLEINNGTAGTLRDLKLRNITVMDTTAVTGSTLAIVQAGAGQSGNLLSVRNNAGTELAGVTSVGAITSVAIQMSASGYFNWSGRTQIFSPSDGNLTLYNAAGSDFGRIQFGGTTSSFPALKRSGATIAFRLADDSADTAFTTSEGIASTAFRTNYDAALRTGGLTLRSLAVIGFSSDATEYGTKDTGLARAAAGYVKVTDGSTGLGKIVVSQSTPSASTDAGTAGAIWADATYIYVQTAAGTIKRVALTTF